MDKKPAEIKFSLAENAKKSEVAFYPISISVINESSVDFRVAEIAVKDNDSNRVATGILQDIPSGGEAHTTVQLPGGIELCIWKITPVVGEIITGFGAANNAPGVRLTITD